MTWVDLSTAFAYGAKLTSTQMQNLRDNIAAAFAKDSGAPTLANDYITNAMIADGAINADSIVSGAVNTVELANYAVTNAKIATGAVNADSIAAGAVDTAELAAGAVTAAKIDTDAVTTACIKTGTGNTSGTLSGSGGSVSVSLQDYCFFPNIYGQLLDPELRGNSGDTSVYTAKFGLENNNANDRNYDIDYRYITASDKPFIYFIRDKKTGEILHTWWADDPPPGYWHLSDEQKSAIENTPLDGWSYPLEISGWDDSKHESFAKFNYPEGTDLFREWTAKAKADKSHFYKHISDNFDFDADSKLFKSKNITEL